MIRLMSIIEKGSLTNPKDLDRLVNILDRRISRIQGKLTEPRARTSCLLDELNKATNYRNEFSNLKNQL